MSKKHLWGASSILAALCVVLLVGGLSDHGSAAPAPAAPAGTPSPFGRLAPVAPVGPTAGSPAAPPVSTAPAPSPAAAAAAAQAAAGGPPVPRVIVIDRNFIMQRSLAGKDMVAQTQNLSKAAETQFRSEQTALET